ncbi:MAG: carboxypeptidase regulatory-like domain-containing protein, partial [Bacteroidia bacterium]|nr:carboxypeptidase regulatory-like domain-containing protein [Bacteroidia bacterium]
DSGKWSQPVNLGPNINTEYDEASPFIQADDSTLFFSSKGHNTMGGYDVFMAQMDTGAIWGKAVNMGFPINSTDDDLYFNVSPDGRRAYYSTVRNDAIGEKDIYEVTFNTPLPVKRVAVLTGYIRSPDNKPIPNDLLIRTTLAKGKAVIRTQVNPKTGKFLQVLRPNETYNVAISTQGKEVFNQNFYLPADSSYFSLSRAFFRTGIILGDTSNVFVPKPKVPLDSMSGSILLNDAPLTPLANMQIQLVDEKGNVIQTTFTDKHGHFTFYKLPVNKSYLLKVDIKDTKLKHLKRLLLANSKGKVVRNFDQNTEDEYFYHDLPANLDELSEISRVAAIPPKIIRIAAEDADFVEYFKYNADQNIQKASNFLALINKIKTRLMHDSVTVSIQSSASKVPTSAQFENSNHVLAEKRGMTEKTTILNALKKRQAKISKLKFEMNAEVQGPDYNGDAQDQDKYQKFKYVKVYVH